MTNFIKKTIFLETHNIKNRCSGLGVFNYELIKALSTLDLKKHELTLNTPKIESLENEFGSTFKYNKYNSLSRHSIFRIRKKYDLWHSMNQNTKIEPFHKNNYLLTVHDIHFAEELSSKSNDKNVKLFKDKLNRASAITYISEYVKKQTHQYFNVPNIPEYIIYNGNPISSILETTSYVPNVPVDKPFFYTIGDFIERKNYESIVNMMELMENYNLIISGNNNKKYGEVIQKLITNKNLTTKVFLTGPVTELSKQFYMKNCAAFLFPSIKEGFGLPPIEAMRFGKPTFLSDKTSLPEIGGDISNYWNNFDPEYMKKIVLDGLNDFENHKTEKEILIKKRATSFSWEKAANKYLNVYDDILS